MSLAFVGHSHKPASFLSLRSLKPLAGLCLPLRSRRSVWHCGRPHSGLTVSCFAVHRPPFRQPHARPAAILLRLPSSLALHFLLPAGYCVLQPLHSLLASLVYHSAARSPPPAIYIAARFPCGGHSPAFCDRTISALQKPPRSAACSHLSIRRFTPHFVPANAGSATAGAALHSGLDRRSSSHPLIPLSCRAACLRLTIFE